MSDLHFKLERAFDRIKLLEQQVDGLTTKPWAAGRGLQEKITIANVLDSEYNVLYWEARSLTTGNVVRRDGLDTLLENLLDNLGVIEDDESD